MTINNVLAAAVLVLGTSVAVSFAGGNCDTKASKASSKGSCCSSTAKAAKATTADADHCATTKATTTATTAGASCSTDNAAASCSTTSSTTAGTAAFKTVKAVKNEGGGCCSMKGKSVKMTSADQVTPKTEATATPEK